MLTLLMGILLFYVGLPYLQSWIQPYREDGAKHHHKAGTPTMGGVLILVGVLVRCLPAVQSPVWWSLFLYGLLGFADDYLKIVTQKSTGLSKKMKFGAQCVFAALLISSIDVSTVVVIGQWHLDLGLLYWPFAVFIIVASSNALNLTDGLDGLATTQAMIILLFFAWYAYLNELYQIMGFTFALLLLLGVFLYYNWHPAKVFMGDVGSLSIGACLGLLAIMLKLELCFALLSLVMVMEVVSVIIQVVAFHRGYRRIFKMAPIHHHFELSGYSEKSIVITFGLLTSMMAGISYWLVLC